MQEKQDIIDLFHTFLQTDVGARSAQFPDFMQELKKLRSQGESEEARSWAKRAVSPLLDYSSLMALRKFVALEATTSGKDNVLRLAILGGPTTVQLRQLIEVFLAGEGIAAQVYECDYGLYRHEIFAPGSGLDSFQPTVVFLAVGARDVTRLPSVDANEQSVADLAEEEIASWVQLWEMINSKWNAVVVQNNFEIAPGSVMGHYALRNPGSREHYLDRINRLMSERAPAYVLLHDLRGIAAEAGAKSWFDPRFYLEFKMPCGAECLVAYAYSVVSLLRAIVGKSKKVLVLDLDNTLWGGVIGDLGAGGIRFGQGSGEGEAFLNFQTYAKELLKRGIVLAVCSKNDDDKAREPFEKRDDMVLKITDISCFIANWEHKADNLRTIADRLELGLDSFVFVDDNPAERAIVRRFLPQVAVPDMPEDPAGYISALGQHRFFETATFTREDTARARYYSENAQRKDLAAKATDVNTFLASLDMRMKVSPVNELNIERTTQLVNKSNQFNLTTKRYTLAQVREMAASPDWRLLTFSLADSLGDNGLIGVLFLHKRADVLAVDTWVMSCRVLLRGVEAFTRNELVAVAEAAGCRQILGTYIPTAKNGMVKDHYSKLGFGTAGEDGEKTFWALNLASGIEPMPHHIKRELTNE